MKTLTLTDRRLIARKIINEVNEVIDLKNKDIEEKLVSGGIIKSFENDSVANILKLRTRLYDKLKDTEKRIEEIDEQYYDFLRRKDIPYLNKKVCLTKEDEIATELLLTNDKELNDVIASLKQSLLRNATK